MQTLTQINQQASNTRHSRFYAFAFTCTPNANYLFPTTTNNYIGTQGGQDLLKITTLNQIFRFFTEPEDLATSYNRIVLKFFDQIVNGRID